ncbi:uncharacterized protein F4822DRAFT_415352 [Hypoxylon trugodes]|uniref:uncharacterized protein n=1 Tax=Hypoxylon trugodes TaxID=326681 RepID=UPI00219EE788|nr:uncharacterized protein F4822DRAFT_415352 [Hypoxylon trugodes]KAI1384484.1 hypothetical protein F4822DRAFT_415352 [Hypoxylon trugodes]
MGISIIPWVLYDNWSVFLITCAGTLLALLSGGLRQWDLEKWPGDRLNRSRENDQAKEPPPPVPAGLVSTSNKGNSDIEQGRSKHSAASSIPSPLLSSRSQLALKKSKVKTVCLTRGNGHRNALILIGSGSDWDLEALATATSTSFPETRWCLVGLAILWVSHLICVAGLESDTWFLLLIGGIGMLQNVYTASAPRAPESLGLKMKPFAERPTIIGSAVDEKRFWFEPRAEEGLNDEDLSPDHELVRREPYLEPWQTVGVRGAIRELEKTIPKAGIAIMPEFFPAVWKIEEGRYRDKREAMFWRWMYKRPKLEDRNQWIVDVVFPVSEWLNLSVSLFIIFINSL